MSDAGLSEHWSADRLKLPSQIAPDDYVKALLASVPEERYDHYRLYPATDKKGWQEFRRERLRDALADEETVFFGDIVDGLALAVGCKLPSWDLNHFGFPIAKITWMVSYNLAGASRVMARLMDECMAFLASRGVKLIVTRVDGDDLANLHLLEDQGYRYYENSLWSVMDYSKMPASFERPNVRFIEDADIERVLDLAGRYQYARSHYYCDERMDRARIDDMYREWFKTSLRRKEPVMVVLDEGEVIGGIVYRFQPSLSKHLGHNYGQPHLMMIEPRSRGKGLGMAMFQGSMYLMSTLGSTWLDTGLASRNHPSARTTITSGFRPVYEEITFHRWL